MTQSTNGVLVINKPSGLTSHDVVHRVRGIVGQRSVGHLGTLDPMATGVLPVVLGNMTRLAQFYLKSEKSYEGVIRFGVATDTYDAEGAPAGPEQPVNLSLEQVRAAAAEFTGQIEQYPPPFSAKKIAGITAHRLARRGQPVDLKPKQVEVKQLEFVSCDGKQARFQAWVSSGTYLRSLAHDLGKKLGSGGHLAELKRTAVREFTIEESHSLEDLEEAKDAGRLDELFLHPRLVLPEFPAVVASGESAARIRHGAAVNLPEFSQAGTVRVFAGQRELLAIARRVAGTLFQPKVVL